MTLTNRTLFFILLTILIIGGGTLSLSTGCTEKTPPSQPPINISILSGWPSYALAFVAEKQGFFAKHGANVKLLLTPDYTESLHLYETGKVEGWYGVLSDMIMLNAKGIPTTVVYDLDYSDTADLIVGRPEFKELSALKGKTISFEGFNTFSHLFVITMLEKAGIHEGEFKAVALPSPQVLAALKSGKIDAGHIYEPASSQAVAEGFNTLAKAGDRLPNVMNSVLAFQANLVKNRPAEIRAIVQALSEAKEFAQTNPKEAFGNIAQAEGGSPEEMETNSKKLHLLSLAENIAAFKPGGALFTLGQEIIDFYEQKGQLYQKPPLDKIIDGQFVFAVRGNH